MELLKDKTILIADDDERNMFAMLSFLELSGINVISAYNGAETLEILNKNNSIDLILMDIMMPGMDGYETIKKIRESTDHKNIPIIAVTAKAMKGDKEKCLEAGATDYISKPVNLAHLTEILEKLLKT